MAEAGATTEAREKAAHVAAERGIALAGAGQRVEHGGSGDRPREHGLLGEQQHALDLALDLGRQVHREIRADAACVHRSSEQRHQQTAESHADLPVTIKREASMISSRLTARDSLLFVYGT